MPLAIWANDDGVDGWQEGGFKLLDNSGSQMDTLRKKLDVLSTQLNIAVSKQKEAVAADQNAKVNEIYSTVRPLVLYPPKPRGLELRDP